MDHNELIAEYERYKSELAEFEKEDYAYKMKISEYGNKVVKQIVSLRELGVEMPFLKEITDDDGNIDLSNENVVRSIIDEVYSVYKNYMDKCKNALLSERM